MVLVPFLVLAFALGFLAGAAWEFFTAKHDDANAEVRHGGPDDTETN